MTPDLKKKKKKYKKKVINEPSGTKRITEKLELLLFLVSW